MQTDVIFLSIYVPEKEFAEDYTVNHEVTDTQCPLEKPVKNWRL